MIMAGMFQPLSYQYLYIINIGGEVMVSLDRIKLGNNIRKERLIRGWREQDIADMTGYSVQYISHIEHGRKNINLEMLINISIIFETTVDVLCADALVY